MMRVHHDDAKHEYALLTAFNRTGDVDSSRHERVTPRCTGQTYDKRFLSDSDIFVSNVDAERKAQAG